jgi:uncharacterized cofD-like protein
VCNIMSQPGETTGYRVSDHIKAIDAAAGQRLFDAVLVQKQPPSAAALHHYSYENSHPIKTDRDELMRLGCRVILANVMEEDPKTHVVRHNSERLARVLVRWYGRVEGLMAPEEATTVAPTYRRPRSGVRSQRPPHKLRP